MEFGGGSCPCSVLAGLKRLRGTRLGIFGYGGRNEDALITGTDGESRGRSRSSRRQLRHGQAIAEVPQDIRGYGHIKEHNIEGAKKREADLLRLFRKPTSSGDQARRRSDRSLTTPATDALVPVELLPHEEAKRRAVDRGEAGGYRMIGRCRCSFADSPSRPATSRERSSPAVLSDLFPCRAAV